MDQYDTHVRPDIVKYLKKDFKTECVWIPKGLTSVLQPCDASLNASFKAHSRMRDQWLQWFADESQI
jgi:hypothetical protein